VPVYPLKLLAFSEKLFFALANTIGAIVIHG
jgi:hypothetical protein